MGVADGLGVAVGSCALIQTQEQIRIMATQIVRILALNMFRSVAPTNPLLLQPLMEVNILEGVGEIVFFVNHVGYRGRHSWDVGDDL